MLLIVAPPDIPRLADVAIDARVLAAVVALSLAIGFVFGLVPLFQSHRGDLQTALKATSVVERPEIAKATLPDRY